MEKETETQIEVLTNTEANTNEEITMEAPLFILFSEYFGYVSMFNKIAEDWCNGDVPEQHIQKVMFVEAKSILRQMKKDYDVKEIREVYNLYFPYVLGEYADKLKKLINT